MPSAIDTTVPFDAPSTEARPTEARPAGAARERSSGQPDAILPIREPDFSYQQHRVYNALALGLSDALALTAAFCAAGLFRLWLYGEPLVPVWTLLVIGAWWAGAALTGLLPSWGLGSVEELRRTTLLTCGTFAGLAATLFLVQRAEAVSRLTITLAFLLSLALIPFARMLVKRLLVVSGYWGIPTAVYGAGDTGRRLVRLLQREQGLGYDPIVAYDDEPSYWGEAVGEDVQVLGSAALVMPYAPVAVLAMPGVSRERVIELMEGPLTHYRTVLVIPDLFDAPSLWTKARDLSGILGLEVKRNLSSRRARITKRLLDLSLVLATAPAWLLLCATCALLIWLEDRANPFFFQERIGRGGGTFKTLKFRTMVPNAEAVLRQRLDEDAALRREWQETFKLKNDPRVTVIGGLMRRLSLDELPQLINVLRGDMSLVGPRPLPAYHSDHLSERAQDLRKRVRPGVTGLWQVTGRSDAGTEGMEKWDPYYVRNWSLWLDIVILVRTLRAVISRKGAY